MSERCEITQRIIFSNKHFICCRFCFGRCHRRVGEQRDAAVDWRQYFTHNTDGGASQVKAVMWGVKNHRETGTSFADVTHLQSENNTESLHTDASWDAPVLQAVIVWISYSNTSLQRLNTKIVFTLFFWSVCDHGWILNRTPRGQRVRVHRRFH